MSNSNSHGPKPPTQHQKLCLLLLSAHLIVNKQSAHSKHLISSLSICVKDHKNISHQKSFCTSYCLCKPSEKANLGILPIYKTQLVQIIDGDNYVL